MQPNSEAVSAKASGPIASKARRSIFQAFLSTMRRMGAKTPAFIDGDGKTYDYQTIARAAFALSGPIARMTTRGEKVGVLLPTGAGLVIAFLAILARGRTPAMLNFTAGAKNIRAAARAAEVTHIVTARKFIEIAGLDKLIAEISPSLTLNYLEDLKNEVTSADKARAAAGPFAPWALAAHPHPDEPAVILFTSGTEGDPKGVVLSHANIIANIEQISAHVRIEPADIFFNPLPAFHCYGLTAGTIWPLISGHRAVLHPSPLHTKIIPQRIMETGATVLFATDTFLQQYMRAATDGAMSSLRLAVCGAERVKDETRQAAERRFSFEVLEGYGVSEAAPVLAANQPGDIRPGTVGKMLPEIETRLEPVEGLESGGRLFVRGPNIMKGYLSPDAPGVVKPLQGGWHDTGDVVVIDPEGYVSIKGRLKRFAKIGGEMVSLAVVENCATALWPDNNHGAVALNDPRRGEQIILVTDRKDAERALLLAWAQSHGVPEIAVPKKLVVVDALPILGTGKMDYVAVRRLAEDGLAALEAAGSAPPTFPPSKQDQKREEKLRKIEELRRRRDQKRAERLARKADREFKKAAE